MNTGQTIGHYTTLRPLLKGGLGEVYLAEDTRLIREVPIKILPKSESKDPGRLKRFRVDSKAPTATMKAEDIPDRLPSLTQGNGALKVTIVKNWVREFEDQP